MYLMIGFHTQKRPSWTGNLKFLSCMTLQRYVNTYVLSEFMVLDVLSSLKSLIYDHAGHVLSSLKQH